MPLTLIKTHNDWNLALDGCPQRALRPGALQRLALGHSRRLALDRVAPARQGLGDLGHLRPCVGGTSSSIVPASDFTTVTPRERAVFLAAVRALASWASLLKKT